MPKQPQDVAAKIVEIYGRVRSCDTPFSMLGMETTRLIASREWTADEVEHMTREVMGLLIDHGWFEQCAQKNPADQLQPQGA